MMELIDAGTPEESREFELAKEIWDQLNRAYPDHPWIVSFTGGAIIVRHAAINAEAAAALKREGFGFTLPRGMLNAECTKSAVQAGGAMLELFNMPRGRWDGRDPIAPKDWSPKQDAKFS